MDTISVRYVGGPTAVLGLGGLRLLTDPTFDPPGEHPIGGTRVLTKTAGPGVSPEEIGPVDAVLLSHDQHPDNLDSSGRELLGTVPLVLSTASARERLGEQVTVLADEATYALARPGGGELRVTGVPARHGPEGCEPLVGEVTGFVLGGEGLPTVYVSGDNASLDVVRTVADRHGPVDVALLFAGAARTALFDGAPLTLTSTDAAEAAKILGAGQVVPLHFEQWGHFSEGRAPLREAFAAAGLADRTHLLGLGDTVTL
ncbi:MAG: MBL fold metallo-hydrolase [Streptosporangiales bacterium]|nr:MBL fold metallo-hydrolase [Streptosporangiales bacterium]